jgi:RNA polymerase sigma-70 factor (ECF subfamily)
MTTNPLSTVLRRLRGVEALRESGDLSDGQLLTRFLGRRDEAAFETLLLRHGPMVLGVCRRVLGHDQDAEDAFQATFLVLARKAGSVVPHERVGNWLYGVAYKTALKARALNAKRRGREKQMPAIPEPPAVRQDQDLWADLQPLLDRELSRLPDKYRFAVVLCDLEGKTHKEAARQLGCPEGTVSVRLSRARALLARRLTQRGLVCSGAALVAALSQNAASAGVPAALVGPTVEAARLFAVGHTAAAGLVSESTAILTEGVLKTMWATKCQAAVLVLALLGVGALACGLLAGGQPVGNNTVAVKPARQQKPKVPEALKEFQGDWKVVALAADGSAAPAEALTRMRWVITGAELRSTDSAANPQTRCTIKIDPDKQPKQIDFVILDGDLKGNTILGIYKLEKGRWTLCLRDEKASGQGRPKDFTAEKGSNLGLITLEKVAGERKEKPGKAGEPKDLLNEDWDRLAGTWVTPFRRSAKGNEDRRMGLELRESGKDHLFNHYDELKRGAGPSEKHPVHNAVLVVSTIREKDGKRFLVVSPKNSRPLFAEVIRYEFTDGRLNLEGSVGTRKLTGTWSRVEEKK